MADDIGSLRVSLSANIAEFQTNLTKAQKILGKTSAQFQRDLNTITTSFKSSAIAAGAIVTAVAAAGGALFALTKAAANLGDELAKASQRAGVSVETLSALKLQAELSDASFEQLTNAFKFLNKGLGELQLGSSKGGKALQTLGIGIEAVSKDLISTEDVFFKVVEGLGKIENQGIKTKLILDIFGKSGAQLIPLLNDLAVSGDNFREVAQRLGLVMSAETAKASEDFNDGLTLLKASMQGLGNTIGQALIPAFTDLIFKTADYIGRNRELLALNIPTGLGLIYEVGRNLIPVISGLGSVTELLSKAFLGAARTGLGFVVLLRDIKSVALQFAEFDLKLKKVDKTVTGFLVKLHPRLAEAFPGLATGVEEATKAVAKNQKELDQLNEAIFNTAAAISDATAEFGRNAQQVQESQKEYKSLKDLFLGVGDSLGAGGGDESEGVIGGVKKTTKALKDSVPALKEVTKLWKEFQSQISTISLLPGIDIPILKTLKGLPEVTEPAFGEIQKQGEDTFNALDAFIADTLGAIRDNMADFVDNFLAGKINSIGDFFQGIVTALRRNIAQLISAIVTAPLEDALKSALSGGKGFLSSLSSLFGGGGGTNPPASAGKPGGGGIFGGAANALLVAGPVIGAILGGITAGIPGAIKGVTTGLGAIGGFLLGGPLGAAIGTAIGSIAGDLIGLLFKKKLPKLSISLGVFDQIDDRIAEVGDFIKALGDRTTAFAQDLIEIGKRGGVKGIDNGELRQAILEIINTQGIQPILGIINLFPSEVARGLTDALKKTKLSADSKAILDLRAAGKDLAEELESHLGELGADFQFAVRPIFAKILEAVGIEAEKASKFIEERFEGFLDLSAEERTAFGQQFINEMNAIVGFLGGAFADATSQALNAVQSLANELGFEAVPSIEQLKEKLIEMINASDLPAGTVEKFKALRDAIIGLRFALAEAIGTIVSKISELNTKIQGLGGAGVFVPLDALKKAIADIQALISSGKLSPDELAEALALMEQMTDQLVNVQLAAQAKAIEAQISGIQQQIQMQERLRDLELEKKRTELDGLREAIRMAEQFRDEFERVGEQLRNLFAGPQSILTPIERLNFLQAEIAKAQASLAGAGTEEERLAAIEKLRELSSELIDLGATAFGTGSPEFQAIFTQTADQLQALLDATEGQAKKVDTLNQQIAKVEAQLEAIGKKFEDNIQGLQNRLAGLQQAGNQLVGAAAVEARKFYEFIQGKYFELLKQKLEQLGQVGVTEVSLLKITNDLLTQIRDRLGGVISAQSGFHGIVKQPQLFATHPNEMVNISPLRNMSNQEFSTGETVLRHDHHFRITLEGEIKEGTAKMLGKGITQAFDDYLRSGQGREIVKQIKR